MQAGAERRMGPVFSLRFTETDRQLLDKAVKVEKPGMWGPQPSLASFIRRAALTAAKATVEGFAENRTTAMVDKVHPGEPAKRPYHKREHSRKRGVYCQKCRRTRCKLVRR